MTSSATKYTQGNCAEAFVIPRTEGCRGGSTALPANTPNEYDDDERVSEDPLLVNRRSMLSSMLLSTSAAACSCCLGVAPAHGLAQIAPPPLESLKQYDLPRNPLQDAAFAQGMAVGMVDYEREAYPTKKRLFESLFRSLQNLEEPTVLEVGMGSFPNALYYKKAAAQPHKYQSLDLIGVDPNDRMAGYAKDNAARAGLLGSDSSLRIVHGVSEALPLEDNSCDAVVCTLTLCSVADPAKSVAEIKRVLKPGGKFLFWEHVLSENDPLLGIQQIETTPAQVKRADGCHLDRRTGETIRAAGFSELELEYMELKNFGLLNPTACGIATA